MGQQYESFQPGAEQVNPYTGQAWEQISNETNMWREMLMQPGMMDPAAGYGYAMGLAPELQELAMGATSPMAQAQTELADVMGAGAVQDVMQAYGGGAGGAGQGLYSGAAMSAASRGAMEPRLQAMANITGAQTGLFGGMMQSVLGSAPGAFQFPAQLAAGLYSQGMGQLGSFGEPLMQAGQAYDPRAGWRELFGGLLGAGATIGGAALTRPPVTNINMG